MQAAVHAYRSELAGLEPIVPSSGTVIAKNGIYV